MRAGAGIAPGLRKARGPDYTPYPNIAQESVNVPSASESVHEHASYVVVTSGLNRPLGRQHFARGDLELGRDGLGVYLGHGGMQPRASCAARSEAITTNSNDPDPLRAADHRPLDVRPKTRATVGSSCLDVKSSSRGVGDTWDVTTGHLTLTRWRFGEGQGQGGLRAQESRDDEYTLRRDPRWPLAHVSAANGTSIVKMQPWPGMLRTGCPLHGPGRPSGPSKVRGRGQSDRSPAGCRRLGTDPPLLSGMPPHSSSTATIRRPPSA